MKYIEMQHILIVEIYKDWIDFIFLNEILSSIIKIKKDMYDLNLCLL